jgi:transposase
VDPACEVIQYERTSLINAIRAHMAEFGIVAGIGRNGVEVLLKLITEGGDDRMTSK